MKQGFTGGISTGFQGMADEEIIRCAKHGSMTATEYLLNKYKGLVVLKARSYFLAGADHEDVIQEGMIGLFKAIRDFRGDRLVHFRAFADLCITRQIITAVKTATRQKHVPLNRYISLHKTTGSDSPDAALIDVLPDNCVVDPERVVLDSHTRECLDDEASMCLSALETQVLQYYMQGMSYNEMASLLSCRTKSVDNALQRVKRKIAGLGLMPT